MAIITDANVTSLTRSLLDEASAENWTDAEITLYIKTAMITILSRYWYLLAPTEAKVQLTNLTVSLSYIGLPTDCAKVLRVEVASDRKMLRKIEVDELYKYSVHTPSATKVSYFNVWYLKYYSTTTDFPEVLRPLIACEAALQGLTKDENTGHIRDLYDKWEEAALTFLSTDSMYEPTVFGDYAMERGFTDGNPVAWCFRDGAIYLYEVYDEE